MSGPTRTKTGQAAGSGPPPTLGPPDIMLWYAAGGRAALETMRTALELNRSLNGIGREVVRRAQDEATFALLRVLALDAARRPPPEAGPGGRGARRRPPGPRRLSPGGGRNPDRRTRWPWSGAAGRGGGASARS